MLARVAGAGLGLLAFTVTAIAGLCVRNPVDVTLSRSILALVLFSVMGLVLGAAAHAVVAEYERSQESEIRRRHEGVGPPSGESSSANSPESRKSATVGTA